MTLPDVHPFLLTLLREGSTTAITPPAPDEPAWENILRDAARQSLTLLLYQWSRESDRAASFPPSLGNQLKAEVARLTAWNLALADELAAILRLCRDRALACAPLRGLALAEQLYGNIAARPMGDIDLLVRREDLFDVTAILTGLGFRAVDHRPGFAETFSYTLTFAKDRHGWVLVEPHWSLAYPPFVGGIDMAAVWTRCIRGEVAGVETWRLAPEDLLLHLSLHLMHGGNEAPLLWYHELDRFLRMEHAALDWEQVIHLARHSGQLPILFEVFRRLKEMCDSPIPENMVPHAKPFVSQAARSVPQLIQRRAVHLLAGQSRLTGREEFALLCMIKGLGPKLRYALSLILPSPDLMRFRYGLHSWTGLGLCYLVRVARLSWEGLKWLAELLNPRRERRHSHQA